MVAAMMALGKDAGVLWPMMAISSVAMVQQRQRRRRRPAAT
jgi:hypothetical protein